MPTVGERLAVVEERVDQMWEWINGGPSTTYDESARGRLHTVTQTLDTADKLAALLKEVRRERSQQWTKAQKIGLFLFAALAAAAPYVLLLVAH